jgi:hypothetical protein
MEDIYQLISLPSNANIWIIILGPLATLISVSVSAYIGVSLFNKGIKRDRDLANEQREKDYEYNRRLDSERREFEISQRKQEREIRLNEFGEYFKELLKSCIDTSKKQVEAYQQYSNALSKDLLGQYFPIQYTNANLNRILELDIQSIQSYFKFKNILNKTFINTMAQFDYLKSVLDVLPDDIFKGNGKIVHDLSNRVIRTRNKMLSIAADYLLNQRKNNPEADQNETFKIINSIVITYHKDNNGEPNIQWDLNKLFEVVKDKFIPEPYRYEAICVDLLNLAKEGSDMIFTIKQFNSQLCADVMTSTLEITESIKTLEEIKDMLFAPE